MSDSDGVFADVDQFLSFSAAKSKVVSLRGLLKEHDDVGFVNFSPTLKCGQWISVEKSSITKIVYLGQVSCGAAGPDDHSHAIAQVEFGNTQSRSYDTLKVIRALTARNDRLAAEMRTLKSDQPALSQIRPDYVGPCGGNWACQDGSVISCTPGVGKPYENININECYCIPC